jgi:hypothetical protein
MAMRGNKFADGVAGTYPITGYHQLSQRQLAARNANRVHDYYATLARGNGVLTPIGDAC